MERVHKACDFCRYRKRKCATSDPSQDRCDLCIDMNIPCRRSYRRRSEKLKHRSQKKAAQALLKISSEINDFVEGPLVYGVAKPSSASVEEQLTSTSSSTVSASISVSDNVAALTTISPQSLSSPDTNPANVYESVIRKFTDYLDRPLLTNPTAIRLLHIAYELLVRESLTLEQLDGYFCEVERLITINIAEQTDSDSVMDGEVALAALLLLNRVRLEPRIESKVYLSLSADSRHIMDLPTSVAAGAIMTNAWASYLGVRPAIDMGYPSTQLDVLQMYNKTLEEDSFSKQYLILTRLLLRMQHLFGLSFEGRRYYWLRLEYDFLLVPLHVPKHLLDLRDDLPGTPYGRILHVMVNTINFELYLHMLKHPKLQEGLQLKPVPAVYHFMLVMAVTVFRYGREVLDKWNILAHCQAKMAMMCLELLDMSDLENCKEVLSYWRDDYDMFPELHRQVQETIGSPPWITEKHFGYSVFWTFRDMRSLHVEGMLPNVENGVI